MSRFVVSNTGLDEFSTGVISCEVHELARLRVALQRSIDEVDDFLALNPNSYLARETKAALEEYRAKEVP